MSESHLLDPAGELVAVLSAQASHEDIIRAAYSLAPEDILAAAADGPEWNLVIFLTGDRPAGDITRSIGVSIKEGAVEEDQITTSLLELAVLDLWDRGWQLEMRA